MLGTRCALAAVALAVLAVSISSASAAPAPRSLAAAPDCSVPTATQLINDNDLNGFLLPNPVVQLLCGPFTGPGTQAMVATIAAGTCWSPQSWVVFELEGDAWQLVQMESAFLAAPLAAVGADVRETTPVFLPSDPRCVPSGGTHARVWHWDGTRFVPGAYTRVGKPKLRTSAVFYSQSRNISCEMNDARPGVGTFVYCQSTSHPHSVRMGLSGRLKTCRGGSLTTTHCLGNPGEHTPVLRYGHHISLRHFRCRSARSGVTCMVSKTGKGFRIDRRGVRPIRP
jgi:hypothetical protein